MVKFRFLLLAVLFCCSHSKGQYSVINSTLGIGVNIISPDHVPFWLRANKFGSIPHPGNSLSFYGSFQKDYDTIENPLIDWGGALEVRANIGNQVQGIEGLIVEGYLKMAISVFQIKAGRDKQVMGLVGDSVLTSGSFAMSGNALGIPKIEVSIPEYYTIPIFDELFAIKGSFAFGWVGQVPIQYLYHGNLFTYFQQSSLYGRLGKPDWRIHLFAGLNHQVFFGNENKVWNNYDLNGWQTFVHAAFGKTWNYSKVGNHLGSIDLGMQYDFNDISVSLYRQTFYDEGALAHLANIADGLNGICFTNTGDKTGSFHWNKILLEFFYSANQAGYPWSKPTKSGDENYYNNYEYANGYSYLGPGIGNPLISSKYDTRPFPNSKYDYFNNNRISALHVGVDATIEDFNIIAKATYSKNFGTFATSPYGNSTGGHYDPPAGVFPESNQVSCLIQFSKSLDNGYSLVAALAFDQGQLLYNTAGVTLQVLKSF